MTKEFNGPECCAICGEEIGESRAYCHFYPGGRRVSLCSIECAEKFLRGPDHHANANGEAHQDFIGELVEEMRWTQYR